MTATKADHTGIPLVDGAWLAYVLDGDAQDLMTKELLSPANQSSRGPISDHR